MGNPLKLHSADSSVGRVRLYQDNIEAYFEFDSTKDKSDFEKLFEALQADIIKWGKDAQKFLKKSKSEQAAFLLDQYDEIYEDFILNIQDENETLKEYRIIKMASGAFYTVHESIEEIDSMIEENDYKEKFGL